MTGHINRIIFHSLFVLLILGFGISAEAQRAGQVNQARNGILLTGVVMDADQHKPLPYTNIRLGNTIYGTASDNNGYFSIFVNPGDTLTFSSIGYRSAIFVMPYGVQEKNYSLIQLLRQEAIMLSEVIIFPWPSIDQFKQAFLDVNPPQDSSDLVREFQQDVRSEVKRNELSEYEADQVRYQRLYEMNQIFPANNFLNPLRWSNFIKDVRKEN